MQHRVQLSKSHVTVWHSRSQLVSGRSRITLPPHWGLAVGKLLTQPQGVVLSHALKDRRVQGPRHIAAGARHDCQLAALVHHFALADCHHHLQNWHNNTDILLHRLVH